MCRPNWLAKFVGLLRPSIVNKSGVYRFRSSSYIYRLKSTFWVRGGVSKTNLLPGTLFWLRCTHSTRVADVTDQNSTWSALTFNHLCHRDIEPCVRLSSVCSQELTACFTSASATNRFLSRCLLRNQWRKNRVSREGGPWPARRGAISSHKCICGYGAQWFPSLWSP